MFRLFTGDGGAIFDGTVQTPLVRADSGNELRSVFATDLEYLNRSITFIVRLMHSIIQNLEVKIYVV